VNGGAGIPGIGSGKPVDIAGQVRNATQAQRYRRQWTEQIEDPDAEGNVRELRAGIDALERRFGDRLPANPLAGGLRRQIGDKRRSAPKAPPEHRPAGEKGRRPPAPPPPRRRTSSRRGGGGGLRLFPSGRGAFEQTGIPGFTRGLARDVMGAIGLMVGLAFLYLLLTNAQRSRRGESAIEQLGSLTSDAVARIIEPIDPLSRSSQEKARARRERRRAGLPGPTGLSGDVAGTVDRLLDQLGQGHGGRRRARPRRQVTQRGPGARTN
jgi:hypothetical protein